MGKNEMKSDFFYSKSTRLYISRKPLKINSRTKQAIDRTGLSIEWDDEGRINFATFDEAKRILSALGSSMLSPVEYWKALRDAQKEKDYGMVHELTSDKYCEWLDRIYSIDKTFIDHPKIVGSNNYSGLKKKSTEPIGRPGWFNPKNNINYKLGFPKKIKLFRSKFETSWKYWTADFSVAKKIPRAPIRGYVTSVGKPSFDMGIPVDAKQQMLMIRECRKKPLDPPIKLNILIKAEEVIKEYNKKNKNSKKCINFINNYGTLFKTSKQIMTYRIREKLFDLLGALRLDALKNSDIETISSLDASAKILGNFDVKKVNYNALVNFVKNSKKELKIALKQKKNIIFVMGHKNPDTDTVISSIFEAWRNSLLDQNSVYIPIVQNYKIPDEVRRLLGNPITDSILLEEDKSYGKAKASGLARWISVDQNREPDLQRFFIAIVDHHAISGVAKVQDLPKTMEIVGSTTALITQKMLGAGFNLDKKLCRILHGATLMDTENRIIHKMTDKDKLIMDYLMQKSEITDENKFYSDLMSYLLNSDNPEILFGRDYKEDWGFGFAVAKIKNGFDSRGKVLKKELINKAVNLAEKNNIEKNFPLTVLRITDYLEDNITVNRERVYLIFHNAEKKFKEKIFELLEKIVRFEFGNVSIRVGKDYLEFWGTGMQLSRKKTAPIFEPVVKVFNEYFYSPSNKLWVKRDFLKKSKKTVNALKELRFKVSYDAKKRINYLTYPEARLLTQKLNFSILTMREYWNALKDAKRIRDIQMIDSLQGSNFVEFWNTVLEENKYMIESPKIKKQKGEYIFEGERKRVHIPFGKPGLIRPDDIDLKTGIPLRVGSPDQYDNPELWRYWEPDERVVIPTRSYIFLLKQPSWDGKFHANDSLPNLGIRPCCKKPPIPKININFNKNQLFIDLMVEGETIKYLWKK